MFDLILTFFFLRPACKVIFIASTIGSRKLDAHIETLATIPELNRIVSLADSDAHVKNLVKGKVETQSYSTFVSSAHSVFLNDSFFRRAEKAVKPEDVLNLQFTSGRYPPLQRKWGASDQVLFL